MYLEQIKNIKTWSRLSATNYWQNLYREVITVGTDVVSWDGCMEADFKYRSVKEMHQGFDWYAQLLDFIPSNLQKGYLAYFICNQCKRRAKYLYYQTPFDGYSSEPLCRVCQGLKYPASRKREARYN
jgi:hypothetical protein